jgi:hypothetical protein
MRVTQKVTKTYVTEEDVIFTCDVCLQPIETDFEQPLGQGELRNGLVMSHVKVEYKHTNCATCPGTESDEELLCIDFCGKCFLTKVVPLAVAPLRVKNWCGNKTLDESMVKVWLSQLK